MFELVYTSAPRGLLPGRSGFSTVAMTAGMPPDLIVPLENLSGYNFTYRNGTLPDEYNPVCCSYTRNRYGNRQLLVASRIAPNGLDYTQRNNKIAHHIMFESAGEIDLLPGAVADIFRTAGNFLTDFQQSPCELPGRRIHRTGQSAGLPARTWQQFAGDAGWAGLIAERFVNDPGNVFYIEYPRKTDLETLLRLLSELSAVIKHRAQLSEFTFSTYFSREIPGTECFLRMVPEDSPLLGNLKRFHPGSLLTLGSDQPLPPTVDDIWLQLSRTGYVAIPEKASPSVTDPEPDAPAPPPEQIHTQQVSPRVQSESRPAAVVPPRRKFTREYVERPSNRRRTIIFCGVAIAVVLAGLWAVLLIQSKPEKIPTENSQPPKTATVSAPPRVMPALELTLPQTPAEDEPIQSPPAAAPPKQPAAAPDLTKLKIFETSKNLTPAQKEKAVCLPSEKEWEMVREYRKNYSEKGFSINLPKRLYSTQAIYANLKKLDTSGNFDEFVKQRRQNTLWILAADRRQTPYKPVADDAESPRLIIEFIPNTHTLKFSSQGAGAQFAMPRFEDVYPIYFQLKDKLYKWSPKPQKKHLKFISKGKIKFGTTSFNYELSPDEKLFKNDITVFIGSLPLDQFIALPLATQSYNDALEKYTAACRPYENLKSQLKDYLSSKDEFPGTEEIKNVEKKIKNIIESRKVSSKKEEAVKTEITALLNSCKTLKSPAGSFPRSALRGLIKDTYKELKDLIEDKEDQYKLWRDEQLKTIDEIIANRLLRQKELPKLESSVRRRDKDLNEKYNQLYNNVTKISPSLKDPVGKIFYKSKGNLQKIQPTEWVSLIPELKKMIRYELNKR